MLSEFLKVAKLNDSLLYHKSRGTWIKEGDSNTKYFHNSAKWRRRTNALRGLTVAGVCVEDPLVVKGKVNNFFENKFKRSPHSRVFLEGAYFK